MKKEITIKKAGTTNPNAIIITEQEFDKLDENYEMKYGFRYFDKNRIYAIYMHTPSLKLYAIQTINNGLLTDEEDIINLKEMLLA